MNLLDEWKTLIPEANKAWARMWDELDEIHAEKIPLWPDKNIPDRDYETDQPEPAVSIFPPIKNSRDFVLIIPGGAFLFKSIHEAMPVATAFYNKGFNVAILNYRCRPHKNEIICMDGMRAVQIIRHYCKASGFSDARVITLGFSAGGILTSLINMNAEKGYAEMSEAVGCSGAQTNGGYSVLHDTVGRSGAQNSMGYSLIDDEISRERILPDAEIFIYGAFTDTGIVDHPTRCYNRLCGFEAGEALKDASESILLRLPTILPPAFFAQTDDDDPLFILDMAKAWRLRGIPCEVHLFRGGGHGGGLYDGNDGAEENIHAAHWFELCCEWIGSL